MRSVSDTRRCLWVAASIGLYIVAGGEAAAAPLPAIDSDRIEREQLDRRLNGDTRERLQKGKAVGSLSAAAPKLGGVGGVFTLKRVEFSASTILKPGQLAAIGARYEGRRLSVDQLQGLIEDIAAAYRSAAFPAGFGAIPDQDLGKGVLRIVLIEPKIDKISVSGTRHVNPDFVATRIGVQSGGLLDLNNLENALNLINRTSAGGLSVQATLAPGGSFGTSSIDIAVREPSRYELSVGYDNYGVIETGRSRALSSFTVNNLSGRDDPLQGGVTIARDLKSAFAAYSTPLWYFVRLNMAATASDSTITAGQFADLGLGTQSYFARSSLSSPLLSTTRWLLGSEAGFEYSKSETKSGSLTIDNKIPQGFGQLSLNYYGDSAGFALTTRVGFAEADITDSGGSSQDQYTIVSGTGFGYATAGMVEGRVRGSWQWTPDKLLPSVLQYAVGGPYSVRGYQSSQFSGDTGFAVSAELRQNIYTPGDEKAYIHQITLLQFVDVGGAFPYRADGTTPQREDYASSVGAGVESSFFDGRLDLSGAVALPLDTVHKTITDGNPRFLVNAKVNVALD